MQFFSVQYERVYSAHHAFIRIARDALKQAEEGIAWNDNTFLTITLSAFSIEAICNGLGALDVARWEKDFERCPSRAKLRLLCMALGITFDPGTQPWADALWLIGLRNRIAHPKLQIIDTVEEASSWAEANAKHRAKPLSDIEQECTIENARRALAAVVALVDCFASKAPHGSALQLDGWSTSTHLQPGTT